MAKHTDSVTASEIATYTYYEESCRLTHGLKIPPGNIRALKRGTANMQHGKRLNDSPHG